MDLSLIAPTYRQSIFPVHLSDLPRASHQQDVRAHQHKRGLNSTGETTMITSAKIALATAFVLGAISAALANDIETNPSTAQSTKEWAEFLGQSPKQMRNAGDSYGYVVSPTQQQNGSQSGKKNRRR
jgi:hypothetical protein